MPVTLPEGQERTAVCLRFSLAQRTALRKMLKSKKSPYNTYGDIVMAAVRGENLNLSVKSPAGKSVPVKAYLNAAEEQELQTAAKNASMSIQSFMRFCLFDESPNRTIGGVIDYINFGLTEDEFAVFDATRRILGVDGSNHQDAKYLLMLICAQVLKAEAKNPVLADITDVSVD